LAAGPPLGIAGLPGKEFKMFRRHSLLAMTLCALLICDLSAQNAAKPITNDDVVAMMKGGLGESTILAAIQSQDNNFDISAMSLLQLKKSGITPKLMDAMLAAAAKRRSAGEGAAAAPKPPASAPTPGLPSVAIVQGSDKQEIPIGRTQIAQTKTKPSTLNALVSDGGLSQALTGVTQGLATAGMMRPRGPGLGIGAMVAAPMLAPAFMATSLLMHRKPTVTDVWALPGQKAEILVHQNQPSFEVQFAGVPGVAADDYEPVLLKVEPTPNNFRLVGATQAKQDELQLSTPDWGMYSSFVEERIRTTAKKIASGSYQLQSAQPLAPGEYAIALRPINKDKKFSGSVVSQNVGDGLVFNSVWAFEVQPVRREP
jgi:hypothetical protein